MANPLQFSGLENTMKVWKGKRYDTSEDKPPRLEGFQNAHGEGQRAITNSSRNNEVGKPKQKQCLVVNVSGDECKIWCCKEQYCIGRWNVRSTNQGKLEVIKQEMARVNIDILGISELTWIGVGEFNSDDHYTYYCGQESLRRKGVAIIVNKRVWNAVLGSNLKKDRMICLFSRQTIQYHNNPSLCPNQ